MTNLADQLTHLILDHAGAWWSYLATTLLCWLDGFFPPLPSESIVIAMSSLHHANVVSFPLLFVCSIIGAWLGDNSAYWIGRLLQLERLFRSKKGQSALAKSRNLLNQKGAIVLLVARFVPGIRVATNMVAGAVRYPVRQFMGTTVISAFVWTTQAMGIGLAAGKLFAHSPLLGICVGVALGMLVGIIIERIHSRWAARHPSRSTDLTDVENTTKQLD